MELKRILAAPWALPLLASGAFAALFVLGSVIAQMMMPDTIGVGQMMVNEEKSYVMAVINHTITDSLNLSVNCLGMDAVSMKVVKPLGSDTPTSIALNLNGTTVLNEQGRQLGTGNVTLLVRGSKQGVFNCTIVPQITNQTQLSWVSSL